MKITKARLREIVREEIYGLIEAKDKAKKTFKFKFKCVECGKVFMKKLTPKKYNLKLILKQDLSNKSLA